MSADIIIGCTISTGGPAGLAPGRASGGKYRRSRYIGTLSMIWNGDGTAPVSKPPYLSTSRPFCAVATSRPTGRVIAERSTTGTPLSERVRVLRSPGTAVVIMAQRPPIIGG